MSLSTFQWRSLKTRVTLFTLAIFLISVGSLAFYTSRILRENIERLTGEQQFSTVSYIAAGLNQDLEDRFKVLETVAAVISPGTMGHAAA
jgi:hypothetical protein